MLQILVTVSLIVLPLNAGNLQCYSCNGDIFDCTEVVSCNSATELCGFEKIEQNDSEHVHFRSICKPKQNCHTAVIADSSCTLLCCAAALCNNRCNFSTSIYSSIANACTDQNYTFSSETNTCVKLHVEAKTFTDARRVCNSELAHLVTLDTEKKIIDLQRMSILKKYTQSFWIGADKPRNVSVFFWPSGLPLIDNLTHWIPPGHPSQPDNAFTKSEKCVYMNYKDSYTWHDTNCNKTLNGFICEQKLNATHEHQVNACRALLFSSFYHHHTSGICFSVLSGQNVTWHEAHQRCKKFPASSLVTIDTENKQKIIMDVINFKQYDTTNFWIGGNAENASDDDFHWIDEQNYSFSSMKTFKPPWGKIDTEANYCGILDYEHNFQLSYRSCDNNLQTHGFICEITPNSLHQFRSTTPTHIHTTAHASTRATITASTHTGTHLPTQSTTLPSIAYTPTRHSSVITTMHSAISTLEHLLSSRTSNLPFTPAMSSIHSTQIPSQSSSNTSHLWTPKTSQSMVSTAAHVSIQTTTQTPTASVATHSATIKSSSSSFTPVKTLTHSIQPTASVTTHSATFKSSSSSFTPVKTTTHAIQISTQSSNISTTNHLAITTTTHSHTHTMSHKVTHTTSQKPTQTPTQLSITSTHLSSLPTKNSQTTTTHASIPSTHTTTHTTTKLPPTATSHLSTTTSAKSPTTRTSSLPVTQVPRSCHVCFGPEELCEKLHEPALCPPNQKYCVNIIDNAEDGTRTVKRGCANFDLCYKEWWLGTSDDDKCRSFDEDHTLTLDFRCTFCCITDNCNDRMSPPIDTLYKDM